MASLSLFCGCHFVFSVEINNRVSEGFTRFIVTNSHVMHRISLTYRHVLPAAHAHLNALRLDESNRWWDGKRLNVLSFFPGVFFFSLGLISAVGNADRSEDF